MLSEFIFFGGKGKDIDIVVALWRLMRSWLQVGALGVIGIRIRKGREGVANCKEMYVMSWMWCFLVASWMLRTKLCNCWCT